MSDTTKQLVQMIHDMGVISERMDEKNKLIESQQATITELKYFAQSIIDHDWHYDSLDDAVRFARAALKESE